MSHYVAQIAAATHIVIGIVEIVHIFSGFFPLLNDVIEWSSSV